MSRASHHIAVSTLLALFFISFATATPLLKFPLSSSPVDIYVAPVNYTHSLLGPLGLPPASSAQWYLPQWDNPLPLNGSSSTVIPGPAKWRCTEQPSPTSVISWRVDNGATRVCAWVDNSTRSASGSSNKLTFEIAQDGTGAGSEAPQVACGLEYDLFIQPTDSNYVNVPINLIEPGAGAPMLSGMKSLSLSFTMRLGNFTHYSRCGALSSCGPSGQLDYAYAVLGIILHNSVLTPQQTLFYHVILADTRTQSECKSDPCTTSFTSWFETKLPTLGISDSTSSLKIPCLQPFAAIATSYEVALLDRLQAIVVEGAKLYGSDSNLSHWGVTGFYIGTGLQGSAVAVYSISDIDLQYS